MATETGSRSPDEAFLGELRDARDAGRRTPDFFVVGHAKCGTTALCEMLAAHPEIFLPVFKETQFLSRAPHHRASPPARRAPLRPQTLEAYLALFADAGPAQRAGEGSTEYLRTPATAGKIAALCPDARIIAAFREPASFLRSLHLQLLEVDNETEPDFGRALALEAQRRRGERIPRHCAWPPALLYSEHVRYVDQLRSYHERFGAERVLVLIYDDFRADNEGIVRQVLRFLGVDAETTIEPVEANPTIRVRSRRAGDLIGSVTMGRGPGGRVAATALKAVTSERLRRRGLGLLKRAVVDSAPPPPDERLMEELRRSFEPEVVALSEYLDRDLVGLWGYDRLAG
jgi:Sulfotransferase family